MTKHVVYNRQQHLLAGIGRYLREHSILKPSDDTLQRLIARQRQKAKKYIFDRICASLSKDLIWNLDELVDTKNGRPSDLHWLKFPPGRPAPKAIIRLTNKLEKISDTGVLELDLFWLKNNFQRSLARHAKRIDANGRTKRAGIKPEEKFKSGFYSFRGPNMT